MAISIAFTPGAHLPASYLARSARACCQVIAKGMCVELLDESVRQTDDETVDDVLWSYRSICLYDMSEEL
jgi:hypothetical protein